VLNLHCAFAPISMLRNSLFLLKPEVAPESQPL